MYAVSFGQYELRFSHLIIIVITKKKKKKKILVYKYVKNRFTFICAINNFNRLSLGKVTS